MNSFRWLPCSRNFLPLLAVIIILPLFTICNGCSKTDDTSAVAPIGGTFPIGGSGAPAPPDSFSILTTVGTQWKYRRYDTLRYYISTNYYDLKTDLATFHWDTTKKPAPARYPGELLFVDSSTETVTNVGMVNPGFTTMSLTLDSIEQLLPGALFMMRVTQSMPIGFSDTDYVYVSSKMILTCHKIGSSGRVDLFLRRPFAGNRTWSGSPQSQTVTDTAYSIGSKVFSPSIYFKNMRFSGTGYGSHSDSQTAGFLFPSVGFLLNYDQSSYVPNLGLNPPGQYFMSRRQLLP